MSVKFSGTPPDSFFRQTRAELARILNQEATELDRSLVKATPSGVSGGGGGLRGGWQLLRASESNLTAVVGQSQRYFLPLEMGRKAGKGISKKGQESVARWAKLKLGLNAKKEAKSFAYLLSEKYRREGRPAVGFAGLAREGDTTKDAKGELEPVSGGIIDQAFQELRRSLNNV